MIQLVHNFFRIATTLCAAGIGIYYFKKHIYQSFADQRQEAQRELDALDQERVRIKKEYTVLASRYTKDLQLGDRLSQCVKRWGDVYRQQQHDAHVLHEQNEARHAAHLKKVAESVHRQALITRAAREVLAQTRAQLTEKFASQDAGQRYVDELISVYKDELHGPN